MERSPTGEIYNKIQVLFVVLAEAMLFAPRFLLCGAAVVAHAGALQLGSSRASQPTMKLTVSPTSQLAQMAKLTTLSIDTGDLDVIKEYGETGLITDATTNPLFVAQAGTSDDARCIAFVDAAIAYAKANADTPEGVPACDGSAGGGAGPRIVKLVRGASQRGGHPRVVRPDESLRRARRLRHVRGRQVPRDRVLIKLAGAGRHPGG